MSILHTINPRADVLKSEAALSVNVSASKALQSILSACLGPTGRFKMLVSSGNVVRITKDGNVLLKEMQLSHPIASILARAAVAQDIVTGDGTLSILIITGEILKQAESVILEGFHRRIISEGLSLAQSWSLPFLESFARRKQIDASSRDILLQVARTSIASKLPNRLLDKLANVIVDAIYCIRPRQTEETLFEGEIPMDLYMVEVVPMKTGIYPTIEFINGMVMDHGARSPNMPRDLRNCYVLTCNISMEYEKTEVNSSFVYSAASELNKLVDAERRYTDNKVMKIIELKNKLCTKENGKNFVIFNQKGIDPPALEILAQAGIFALRRVKRRNMERLTLCCGGMPLNSVENLKESDLGYAEHVWEVDFEEEKFTFVDGVKDPRSCAIVIKSQNETETERIKDSIRDALRACKNAIDDQALVPGAASFEMALYHHLIEKVKSHPDQKVAVGVKVVANALLSINRALCQNSGLFPQEILAKFEAARANADPLDDIGLNIHNGELFKAGDAGIWDNVCVKKQTIILSTTLASQLLLIDEIIRAGRKRTNDQAPPMM